MVYFLRQGYNNRIISGKAGVLTANGIFERHQLSIMLLIMDCHVTVRRESRRITVTTENGGIQIRSITLLQEDIPEIYVALTGDQCVLTNIKIS